jgi:hypothetical protein
MWLKPHVIVPYGVEASCNSVFLWGWNLMWSCLVNGLEALCNRILLCGWSFLLSCVVMGLNSPRSSYSIDILCFYSWTASYPHLPRSVVAITATVLLCAPVTRTVQQVPGMLLYRRRVGILTAVELAWVLSVSGRVIVCFTHSSAWNSTET